MTAMAPAGSSEIERRTVAFEARPIQRRLIQAAEEIRQNTVDEISDPFFSALQGHSVPLNPRALTCLAHSPLALDVYCWLAQRLHRIPEEDSAFVPWASLYRQFGGFSRLRDFRAHFLGALSTVTRAVYRDAQITEEVARNGLPTGLRLRYAPPPVPVAIKGDK